MAGTGSEVSRSTERQSEVGWRESRGSSSQEQRQQCSGRADDPGVLARIGALATPGTNTSRASRAAGRTRSQPGWSARRSHRRPRREPRQRGQSSIGELSQTPHGVVVEDQPIGLSEDFRPHHDSTRQRLRATRLNKCLPEPSGSAETDDRWTVGHNANLVRRPLAQIDVPVPQKVGTERVRTTHALRPTASHSAASTNLTCRSSAFSANGHHRRSDRCWPSAGSSGSCPSTGT